jgi:hypothetical protein
MAKSPIERTALLAEIGQAILDSVKESGLLRPKRRANTRSKRKSNPSRTSRAKVKTKGQKLASTPLD